MMNQTESIFGSYGQTLDGDPVIGAVTSIGIPEQTSVGQLLPVVVPHQELMSASPLAVRRMPLSQEGVPAAAPQLLPHAKSQPIHVLPVSLFPAMAPSKVDVGWSQHQQHQRSLSTSGSSSSTEVPSASPLNAKALPLPEFHMQPFQQQFFQKVTTPYEPHAARYIQSSTTPPAPAADVAPSRVIGTMSASAGYSKISPQEAGDRIVQRITMTHSLNKPVKMTDPDNPVPVTLPSHAFDPIVPQKMGARQGGSPSPGLFRYSIPSAFPPADARHHFPRATPVPPQPTRERVLSRETLIPGTEDDILSLADLDRKLSIAYSSISVPKKKLAKGHHRSAKGEPSRRRYSAEEQQQGRGWFGGWGRAGRTDNAGAGKRRHSVPTKHEVPKHTKTSRGGGRRKGQSAQRHRMGVESENTTTCDDVRSYDAWSSAISSIEESFFDRRRDGGGRPRYVGTAARQRRMALVGGSRRYLPPVEYLGRGGGAPAGILPGATPMLPPVGPAPMGPPMLMDAMEISPVASRSMLTCNTEFRKQYPYVYQALCKGILDVQKLIAHEIVIPIKEDVALKRSAIRSRKAVTGAICDQLWRSLQGRFPDPQVAPKLIKKIADYFYDKVEFGIQDAEDERSFLQWFFRFEVENAVDLRQNITIVAGKNTVICNLEGSGRLKRKKGEFFNVISPDQVLLNIECVIKALFLNGGHLQEINMDTIFVDRVASGQNLFARNFIGY